jgi:uncharacterized protein
MTALQVLLAIASGTLVGFTLGLVGGGGSILAVPLLVYVVRVPDPHLAIGTTAFAVSVNAFANLALHARAGRVQWGSAAIFALSGIGGAAAGSTLGKLMNGQSLLALLALLMLLVGWQMYNGATAVDSAAVSGQRRSTTKLVAIGFGVGALSGFFGIGGGFLCVPGLMLAAGMAIPEAIGSSLLSVASFGMTTAINYAFAGLVDLSLAALVLIGGIAGGLLGTRLAGLLAGRRAALNRIFAAAITALALYMLYRTFEVIGS